VPTREPDSSATPAGDPVEDLGPYGSEGDPSSAELLEMVLAEKNAMQQAVERFGAGSRTAETHAGILRLLVQRAVTSLSGSQRGGSPLELAARYADVFPSGADGPPTDSSTLDRAVQTGLGPLNTEVLRPQAEFNRALVEVLGQLWGAAHATEQGWVRARLEPLADPTAFRVHSHRDSLLGRLVETAKKSWLAATGPLFDTALAQQRRWNLAVLDFLEARFSRTGSAQALDAAIESIDGSERVAEGAEANADAAARLFVSDLFKRQQRFNQHVTSLLLAEANRPHAVPGYSAWVERREALRARALEEALRKLPNPPRLSMVVAAKGALPAQLSATLASLDAQRYPNWDVTVRGLDATHPRLREEARLESEWVGFIDAGDVLSTTALAEVAVRVANEPGLELLYVDEDRIDAGARSEPFFKPDFSLELLTGCDFVSRALFARRAWLPQLSEANRYEAVLELARASRPIGHVSEALYSRASTGDRRADFVPRGGRAALERFFAAQGVRATVDETPAGFAVRYVATTRPLISLIVPFRDRPELLEQLTRSLKETRYDNYELLLVSNQSKEARTHGFLRALDDKRIRTLEWNHPFNYPAINNHAAKTAKGEVLVFLNNDIEITDPDWLGTLAAHLEQPGVAAVGPKLVFPDGRIQHAGVVVGMGGFGGHPFAQLPDDARWTPFGLADWPREVLALSSACLMVRRRDFEAVGGFDERFVVCGSDVDICLRLRRQPDRNHIVYTPRARLVHHESASRSGSAIPSTDFWESLRAYGSYLAQDPFFSPRLSLSSTAPSLRPEDEPAAIEVALKHLGAIAPRPTVSSLASGRIAYNRRVQGLVRTLDADRKAFSPVAQRRLTRPIRTITWLLPSFSHPFGGVHTIFRFADAWARDHHVENHFVIYDNPNVSPREIAARASVLGPRSPESFTVLSNAEAVARLPSSDVLIATAWPSAYASLRHPAAGFRAYFVQDDESMFQAAGSLSALANNTYRFGFYGIFNGRGLYDELTRLHGMHGTWFEPGVDGELFHSNGRQASSPTRIFFYARPSIDRNAFELGLEALRVVKNRHGDAVHIVSAGEVWQPSTFDAEGLIENLGVLPYRDTPALYRSVDIGLALMMTRHPSYLPLELMACGVTVVSTENTANGWLYAPGENCLLAPPTVTCLAEELLKLVTQPELRARLGAAASMRIGKVHWEEQTRRAFEALSAAATSRAG
jgi:O-antigen biosynthesis protein